MDIAALSIGRTLISEPRPDRRITIEVDHEVRPQSLEEEGVLDRFKCRQSCFFRETGHCLAPTLLGCYLTDAYDGDVRCRSEVAGHLAHDVRQGLHARKVMESYQACFSRHNLLNDKALCLGSCASHDNFSPRSPTTSF